MATLRTVFILALVLVSLPALYAASAPLRGDVAAGGSAGEDAASWGRKLLEASGGDLDVGGEEEEVGEATDDGLDEAVRVLLSWKKIKNAANQAAKSEAGQKAGGLVKNVVKKGGKEALTAAVNAFRSGKGAKGALQAGAGSFHVLSPIHPSHAVLALTPSLPSPTAPASEPLEGGISPCDIPCHPFASLRLSLPFHTQAAPASDGRVPAGQPSEPLEWGSKLVIATLTALHPCIHPCPSLPSCTAPASDGRVPAGQPDEPLERGSQPVRTVQQSCACVFHCGSPIHRSAPYICPRLPTFPTAAAS
ncbi:unnamed protein product [Closterium sp. Naga37s-1]|nr:unnamed protein product [Closterium sp. Naga37s-1]